MEDVMRICPRLAITLLLSTPLLASAADPAPGQPRFPAEMLGVWDAYPLACVDDGPSDSDMRIQITPAVLHGYENNDTVRSIKPIAESPMAWRVVTISDIAPEEIQGEADIYVLRGDALTITNGERAYTYRRCR
ncbi:hypothetical protein [Luteimonas sp. MC1750]|nr:hypothetical protein [Luteimonas sp. MC1750]MBJ6985019.1 hypothetical protein [Luteimonas sp. MC1750]QQO05687.1 hypothetical protein JGR68_12860 [Luteimonas sp. MC1750]